MEQHSAIYHEVDQGEVELSRQAEELARRATTQGGELNYNLAVDYLIAMEGMRRISLTDGLMGRHSLQATYATEAIKTLLDYGDPDQQMTAMRYTNEVAACLPFRCGNTPDDIRKTWDCLMASLGVEPVSPDSSSEFAEGYLLSVSEQLASWYVKAEDMPSPAPDEGFDDYLLETVRSFIAEKIQQGSRRLY